MGGEGEYEVGRNIANSSDYGSYKAQNPNSPDLIAEEGGESARVLSEEGEQIEAPPSVVLSPTEEKEQEILRLAAEIEIVTQRIVAHGSNFIKGQENTLNLLKKFNAELVSNLSIFSRSFPVHLRTNIVRIAENRLDYKDYLEGISQKLKDYLVLLESGKK